MTADIVGEAKTLVRALEGVADARIDGDGSDIHAIHVTARDDDAARHMAAHVRSALLAGLTASVLPDRIHVTVAAGKDLERPDRPDQKAGPRDRIRLLHDLPDSPIPSADPQTPAPADDPADDRDDNVDDDIGDAGEAPVRSGPAGEDVSPVARPRLVAVDADRPGDGRVLCSVAIAYRTRVHRAEAVAVDLPGAAAQAAAQATVRALIDAGIPGLELSGLREVEIAGREYVLVALRSAEPYTRTRSGSAPIIGSPERSAAEATVAAALNMS